jgi:hypothetical protein
VTGTWACAVVPWCAKQRQENATPIFDDTRPIELNVASTDNGPVFTWEDPGRSSVFLAIFMGTPIVVENKIRNEGSLVWAWHSGLGTGSAGRVHYQDGVAVRGGVFREVDEELPALEPGTYRAALWSYNRNGELADSSAIQEFSVLSP